MAPPEHFNGGKPLVELTRRHGIRVLNVLREIDVYSVNEFLRIAGEAAESEQRLILTFEQCTYCDSQGIRAVVDLYRRLGTGLVVVSSGHIRRIMDITMLGQLITIVDTLDEAVANLQRHPSFDNRDDREEDE